MAQGLSSGQSSGQFAHLLGIGSPPRMVGKRQQPEQYSAPRPGEDKVFCGNPCAAGIPTKNCLRARSAILVRTWANHRAKQRSTARAKQGSTGIYSANA